MCMFTTQHAPVYTWTFVQTCNSHLSISVIIALRYRTWIGSHAGSDSWTDDQHAKDIKRRFSGLNIQSCKNLKIWKIYVGLYHPYFVYYFIYTWHVFVRALKNNIIYIHSSQFPGRCVRSINTITRGEASSRVFFTSHTLIFLRNFPDAWRVRS